MDALTRERYQSANSGGVDYTSDMLPAAKGLVDVAWDADRSMLKEALEFGTPIDPRAWESRSRAHNLHDIIVCHARDLLDEGYPNFDGQKCKANCQGMMGLIPSSVLSKMPYSLDKAMLELLRSQPNMEVLDPIKQAGLPTDQS
ncbi:MAG TPA: hypothetical protein VGN26_14140 [Armatimonadota bacterium]